MKIKLWTGRVISAVAGIFVLASGINVAVVRSPAVLEQFAKFGYPPNAPVPIGIAAIVSAALYLIPQTSVFGAIFLTAYLGGATATHVRVSDPMFVVPIIVGILVWIGIYLREHRLSELVPIRRP